MSYNTDNFPYKVYTADKDGLFDFLESFSSDYEAEEYAQRKAEEIKASPNREDYAGCHIAIVKYEVEGFSDWLEPVKNFSI